MKGNPTAGIILLVAASLFIALGTKYRERVKGAWNYLMGGSPAAVPTSPIGNGTIGSQGGANA